MLGQNLKRLKKSLKKRGVIGTLQMSLKLMSSQILNQVPSYKRAQLRAMQHDYDFDDNFGVDTKGNIHLSALRIDSKNWEFGLGYQGTDPSIFAQMFQVLNIQYEDFLFIDFGSGKGRALLLASEFPFRKMIGIEFSPQLHQIAAQNVRSFQNPRQKSQAFELLCMDVVDYSLPPEPAVCYFFNPFEREVMVWIIEKIRQSYEAHPREIYVLYETPEMDQLWAGAGFLKKIKSGKGFSCYKNRN